MKKLIIITLLSLCSFVYAQDKGTVSGTISDKEMNGEALPFANVFIKGTTIGATTDMDGKYSLSIPSGSQTIVFSFVGYQTVEKAIAVKANQNLVVNQQLGASEGVSLDEIEIKATVSREKESALLLQQKKATVIIESIGAQELSKKGVSNAAAATTKISGVTKSEGTGDIYIRGLGDRYLSTSMNGLPVPSDNVNNKNINLNLFNTNIIQNVGISKTYTTNNYADQGSGSVNIISKEFSKKGIKIGLSGGSNTNVMELSDFRKTIINEDVTFGFHEKKYALQDALTRQGWDTKTTNIPFNYGASIGGGYKFDIFGKALKFVASASYSSSNSYQEGLFRSYKANILDKGFSYNEQHDTEKYITNTNATGYINFSLKLNDNNKLKYNTLVVNKSQDLLYEQGRKGFGYVYDQDPSEYGAFVRDQNFKQTTLFVNQLMGEHKLDENNTLNWAGGYNFVLAEEPNRIRNEVNILDPEKPSSQIQYAHVGDYQQRKSSQKIEDNDYNALIQNKLALGQSADEFEKKPHALNYGINIRKKERSFKSLFVGVKAKGMKAPSVDNITDTFTASNFNPDLYPNLELKVRPNDTYSADLKAYAAFVNFDFQLDEKLSGNLGLRFEKDEINMDWSVANYIDQITGKERIGSLNKKYEGLYPSVNLKYELNEKNYLRFASSVTQTLPEFKELAPLEYVSPTGRVTRGNLDLEKSDIYNIDLKWEFFPSREELVSATVFYKQIKNPINLGLTRGSSGNFIFENTGDKADVLGLEVEGKVGLIKNEDEKSLLSATGNVTVMYLNQDLHKEFQYKDVTESKLQGASNFIFNGSVSYNSQTEKPFIGTVTGNYSSDKIFSLGAPRSQDDRATLYNDQIIQKGFFTLDAILSKEITKYLTVKLVGKNLLNPEIKQTQLVRNTSTGIETNETVQLYKKGQQLSLGLSLSF
ncbi:TonB-dependent receptor [Tenacibaculum piscium]|uniref:TonB-dependent receptor n=1 Tax=Tenacibaculum piscium TaxID=1458515 RepID=UPI001F43EA83|nr:TonB-dependent receptor [Tenacibaculum piscium]